MIEGIIIFSILTGVTNPTCPQDLLPTMLILAPDGRFVELPSLDEAPALKPECTKPDDGTEKI